MKAILVVAFAVLLFAAAVRADSVGTSVAVLTIPDGSLVTSVTFFETPASEPYGGMALVTYDFAGGTGDTEGNGFLGYSGTINFSSPVSDVSFDWFGGPFGASDNVGDSFFNLNEPVPPFSGTEVFSGPGIAQITWYSYTPPAVGGIESISYTADPQSVTEPSSLLLLGMGLAALIGLARCNRTKSRTATV